MPVDPAGDGKATCPPVSLAMAGALTGPDAALGINIKNGVQLAIDQHNKANPGCQVQLKPFDTEGDPQKATQVAPQIVDDAFIIGLIGPAFSGETKATGQIFDQAGLVAATASATNVTLSEHGWKTFFRGLANDGVQGAVGGQLPEEQPRLQEGLRRRRQHRLRSRPGQSGPRHPRARSPTPSCNISVKKGDKDFSAAVKQVKGASPDAVFYAGYYAEAAPFVQQLRDGGVTATFVSARRHQGPGVRQAGRRSVQGRHPVLPLRPGHRRVRHAVQGRSSARTPGIYSTRGLRPDHDHAHGHRLGQDHPPRPAGLRAQLRRSGCGP